MARAGHGQVVVGTCDKCGIEAPLMFARVHDKKFDVCVPCADGLMEENDV